MILFLVPHLRAIADVRDAVKAAGTLVLKSAVVAHDRALEYVLQSEDLDE